VRLGTVEHHDGVLLGGRSEGIAKDIADVVKEEKV
jgi:hypothetical protein